MTLVAGALIGPYEIVAPLGSGGMGEVYRARDTRLDRDVALKILPDLFAADPDRLARFAREAKTLAALNHPHIAQVYGFEQSGASSALVMELVEGDDLAQRIASGRIPIDDAVAIARQIADALEAAHEQGIVHRDLKPTNIKVRADGTVKVLDFGLAKAGAAGRTGGAGTDDIINSPTITSPAITQAGVVLGTAAYMAPEQARGLAVDKRADIWAFGCVLYEMLIGRQAFAGDTLADVLAAVVQREPDWDALPATTPPPVVALLRRCLARDPRIRLRDIGEARVALDVGAHAPVASLESAHPIHRRRGVTLGWLAALLLAVVLGRLSASWFTAPEERPRPLKVHALVARPGHQIADAMISPDGQEIVYRSEEQLWVQRLDEWRPQALADSQDAQAPFWSPDGEWIAYFTPTQLVIIPRAGGTKTIIAPVATTTAGGSRSGAWHEDGTIFFARDDGAVYRVPSSGGTAAVAVPVIGDVLDYHDPAVLPGRKEIAVVLHRTGGVNSIAIADDNTLTPVLSVSEGSVGQVVYSPTGHLLYERRGQNVGVWALPFSLSALQATGEPFAVAPGIAPSVSRDGTLAMINAADVPSRELIWVDDSGRKVETIAAPRQWRQGPALTADGRQLAVVDETGIWAIAVASGARSRITGHSTDATPVWVAGGTQLAFARIENGVSSILLKRADAGAEERVIARGARFPTVPDDGRYLVFNQRPSVTTEPGQTWNIAWIDLSKPGEVHELKETHAGGRFPAISPDARWLLYLSAETGRDELYLTRFPTGEGKWQLSQNGASYAQWTPRGDGIIYRSRGQQMVVTIAGSEPHIGPTRRLFAWDSAWVPWYAVAADGRFVTAAAVDATSIVPSVRLVRHWIEEFVSR